MDFKKKGWVSLERSEPPDGHKKTPLLMEGDLIYFEVVKYSENMGKY